MTGASDLGYLPVPLDGHEARWQTWDGTGLEHCTLRFENEAWTVEGLVRGVDVHYVLRCSASWQVQQLLLFRDLDDPDLWLATDGAGRWGEVNGAHRAELDGCTELALGCTPLTHSIPIRRLPLHVGDAAEIDVVVVDVDTLAVQRQHRRYARLGSHRWRIDVWPPDVAPTRSVDPDAISTVELEVDEHGLVLDEPGRFRRLA